MKHQASIWRKYLFLGLQAIILCCLAIWLRLPFQSQILHEWDSVQFALALDNFDIRLHQPHPPGMFVIYVFLGRFLNLFMADANTSLVWLSTLSAGLATATIFLLTTTWFGRQTGLITALLILASPLVWFQGEVALSYMLEFFWTLLIVWGCFYLRYGNKFAFYSSTILLGLAGGIRPNTLFFLAPLWLAAFLFGLRNNKYQIKHFLIALFLGLIAVACWFLPLVMMSGGFPEYWQGMQPWLNKHPQDGVGRSFQGVYLNLKMLVEALLYGLGFSLISLIWILRRQGKQIISKWRSDWRLQTLLLWIIPGFCYLLLIHIQRLGHTFTILPALIIIAGWATSRAMGELQLSRPKSAVILLFLILIGNGLFFLLFPGKLDNIPVWQTIRDYDLQISERVQLISQEFIPEETMVITRGRNSRIREFYLPEYTGSSRVYEPGKETEILPANLRNLVLFGDRVMSELNPDSGYQTLKLPTTGEIRYFSWSKNQQVTLSKNKVEIK